MRLKPGTLVGPLPTVDCSENVFAMDVLMESRFTYRQSQTVQPFAMVGVMQVGRYKTCRKKAKPVAVSLELLAGNWRFKRNLSSSCRLGSGQSPPKQATVSATPQQRGQGNAAQRASQPLCSDPHVFVRPLWLSLI